MDSGAVSEKKVFGHEEGDETRTCGEEPVAYEERKEKAPDVPGQGAPKLTGSDGLSSYLWQRSIDAENPEAEPRAEHRDRRHSPGRIGVDPCKQRQPIDPSNGADDERHNGAKAYERGETQEDTQSVGSSGSHGRLVEKEKLPENASNCPLVAHRANVPGSCSEPLRVFPRLDHHSA